MQVGEGEQHRSQAAAGVAVQSVRDAPVERDQRAARGDVPRDGEKDQPGDKQRAPAGNRQRPRREARRVRLAQIDRWVSGHRRRGLQSAFPSDAVLRSYFVSAFFASRSAFFASFFALRSARFASRFALRASRSAFFSALDSVASSFAFLPASRAFWPMVSFFSSALVWAKAGRAKPNTAAIRTAIKRLITTSFGGWGTAVLAEARLSINRACVASGRSCHEPFLRNCGRFLRP